MSRGKTEIASPSALLQTGIRDRFAYLWASRQQWHHTLRMSLIAQATPHTAIPSDHDADGDGDLDSQAAGSVYSKFARSACLTLW